MIQRKAKATKRWVVLAALLLASVMLCMAPPAQAGWIQNFDFIDGNFDQMEIFIIGNDAGGPFEAPGLGNIIDEGNGTNTWTANLINPGYILAAGDTTSWLNGYINFAGDMNSPVTFDILFWDNITSPGEMLLADSVRQIYDPTGGFLSDFIPPGTEYNRTPVPEPSTILLLCAGILGIGTMRKKSGKQ